MNDDNSRNNSRGILVVDDEEAALHGVRRTLRSRGFQRVLLCQDSRDAVSMIESNPVSIVLLDLIMPNVGGEEVLQEVAERWPDLPVIIVTAEYEVHSVVRCMKLGAIDYLLKPVDAEALVAIVERALEQSALRYECERLRDQFFNDELQRPECFAEILTSDPVMLRLFSYLEAISRGSQPVLIVGETGTGKELVAKALHAASDREGPFVAVNVAGLDDTMFSDTLFGHHTGAFTGADAGRRGMIDKAGEGTLFLDEIGDLPEASQVKLLRLLQEREYYPLGSDGSRPLRARVIAATHCDLDHLRRDLYYRLRSYLVRVPPLRERLGDLPALLDCFLESAVDDLGRTQPTAPPELLVYLSNYDFPGRGVMALQPFLEHVGMDETQSLMSDSMENGEVRFPYPIPSLRQIEQTAVNEALRRVQGNQSAAARMLQVSRPTIARHMAKDLSERQEE